MCSQSGEVCPCQFEGASQVCFNSLNSPMLPRELRSALDKLSDCTGNARRIPSSHNRVCFSQNLQVSSKVCWCQQELLGHYGYLPVTNLEDKSHSLATHYNFYCSFWCSHALCIEEAFCDTLICCTLTVVSTSRRDQYSNWKSFKSIWRPTPHLLDQDGLQCFLLPISWFYLLHFGHILVAGKMAVILLLFIFLLIPVLFDSLYFHQSLVWHCIIWFLYLIM